MRKITKFLMLFVLCLIGMQGNAQNVTIRGNNGSMIPAVKDGGASDTFFKVGGFATWQHEQLSMVLTVSDGTALTQNGQLDNPANNLFSDGEHIQIAKGQVNNANVCYVSLSLPQGYRFTRYIINFTKPEGVTYDGTAFNNTTSVTFNSSGQSSTFGETNSTFSTYTTQATISTGGSEQQITRTESENSPMGNVLYFKLQNPSNARALITLTSAMFYFTAEENYTPVVPTGNYTSQHAVDIPFATSKVDYGSIEERTYNGATRVSYSSANVTDLEAKMVLYEAESTESGAGVDGTSGQVVKYGDGGTISSEGNYFKLGKTGAEQVYFIETPTYVELSDGTKNPVGYRIVGAEFEYTNSTVEKTFYITYRYNNATYYLYANGTSVRWLNSNYQRTVWTMDADGYISCAYGYLYFNNGYAATQTEQPGESEMFAVDNNNGIYQINYPDYYIRWYRQNGTNYCIISKDNGSNATYSQQATSGQSYDNFTLKIYSANGDNPQTIPVSRHGKTSVPNLNNDAVKFGVQGIGLVTCRLTLQALDPYLDYMEVVLRDDDVEDVRMWETFTASDFEVNGGEFFFYMPNDLLPELTAEDPYAHTTISFENLRSKYFDETYTNGHSANKSRLNFVKSQHYLAFNDPNSTEEDPMDETDNNIYYNRTEAASSTLESTRLAYTDPTTGAVVGQNVRTNVNIVGDHPFKFNNAADVTGEEGGTYTEYPFSLENYADAPNNGSFYVMKFDVSRNSTDQQQTGYVFTTDETRYNIAPTTATQHRAYAYYVMVVHVQPTTYSPTVEFVPLYTHTNYDNSAATGGNVDEDKAFYGAVVTAYYGEDNERGYASTSSIFQAINDKIQNPGSDPAPASAKEILYLDFSQLKGVYQVTDATHQSMEDYSASNAANCLIFLPEGHSASNNNVAYKLEAGTFQAANHIVLTDKQPFFSPYDIQVDAANYAMYTRNLTFTGYDTDKLAMVMLPYELSLDANGKHTNPSVTVNNVELPAGQNSFEVKVMDSALLTAEDGLSTPSAVNHDYGIAYFAPVTSGKAAANTPYMVKVDEASVVGENVSFVAIQKGALIKATTGMKSRSGTGEDTGESPDVYTRNYTYNYLYTGETVTGSTDVPGESVTLTSEGSYSGQKYDRAHSEKIFYFADNEFLNLYKLNADLRYLYAYPFHPVYTFSGGYSNVNGLSITFEPFVVDYIHEVNKSFTPDLAVRSGKGFIQMTSDKSQMVDIRSLNGTSYSMVNMNAGDSKTVKLPAGVYLVNNVKIIVK